MGGGSTLLARWTGRRRQYFLLCFVAWVAVLMLLTLYLGVGRPASSRKWRTTNDRQREAGRTVARGVACRVPGVRRLDRNRGGGVVSADYRPWEIQRLVGRCASCGETKRLEENGLCAGCENKTRGNQAWAPALPPVTSGGRKEPDPDASSFGSRPTIESAGSARFYGGSRDTW